MLTWLTRLTVMPLFWASSRNDTCHGAVLLGVRRGGGMANMPSVDSEAVAVDAVLMVGLRVGAPVSADDLGDISASGGSVGA
jgi:hypothetical protein